MKTYSFSFVDTEENTACCMITYTHVTISLADDLTMPTVVLTYLPNFIIEVFYDTWLNNFRTLLFAPLTDTGPANQITLIPTTYYSECYLKSNTRIFSDLL